MEIYPTCLRQSGISIGAICANSLGIFGPYVIYLGTEFDVRYPYMIMGKLEGWSSLTLLSERHLSFQDRFVS